MNDNINMTLITNNKVYYNLIINKTLTINVIITKNCDSNQDKNLKCLCLYSIYSLANYNSSLYKNVFLYIKVNFLMYLMSNQSLVSCSKRYTVLNSNVDVHHYTFILKNFYFFVFFIDFRILSFIWSNVILSS